MLAEVLVTTIALRMGNIIAKKGLTETCTLNGYDLTLLTGVAVFLTAFALAQQPGFGTGSWERITDPRNRRSAMIVVAGYVFWALGSISWFRLLKTTPVSTMSLMVGAFGSIFVMFMSYTLLGESFNKYKQVGLVCYLGAVYCLHLSSKLEGGK